MNKHRLFWALNTTIAAGILLRVVVYVQNRSLFLDEANLALNIAERKGAGFFTNLDHDQYAPPLFLWLSKASTALFSYSESGLRLVPLLAGCATLFVLARLALTLQRRLPAQDQDRALPTGLLLLLLMALVASSPILIRYATECKQYSLDTFLTGLVLWTALRYPPDRPAAKVSWWMAGLVLPWLSMPIVFILAGVGVYFLAKANNQKSRWLELILMYGCWLLSFGAYYLLILRADAGRGDLQAYHASYFLPVPPTSWGEVERAGSLLIAPVRGLAGHTVLAYAVGGLGVVTAVIYSIRQRLVWSWLWIVPLAATFLASALGLYSLIPRMQLFLYPVYFLLIFVGLRWLCLHLPRWGRWLLLGLLVLMLPAQAGYRYLSEPLAWEEMRPFLQQVQAADVPADRFWINYGAAPAVRYYQTYHPRREEWPTFDAARFLEWGADVVTRIDGRPLPQYILYGHVAHPSEFARVERDQDRLERQGYRTTIERGVGVAWLKVE